MMNDELQAGHFVQHLRKHDASLRRARFIRPAERPPDFILRLRFHQIVRKIRRARRMNPHGLSKFFHLLEHGAEFLSVESLAAYVRKDLNSTCAQLGDCPARFFYRTFGIAHRNRWNETWKTLRVFLTKLSH